MISSRLCPSSKNLYVKTMYVIRKQRFATLFATVAAFAIVSPLFSATGSEQPDKPKFEVFPVGEWPVSLAFDGSNIWVVNTSGSSITKLRTEDGSTLGTFGVGTWPSYVAFDGVNIWVTNSADDTVTKLRASDGGLIGAFSVGDGPGDILFEGDNIWITNVLDETLVKLRPDDATILGTYPVGDPRRMTSDGTNIWIANNRQGT